MASELDYLRTCVRRIHRIAAECFDLNTIERLRHLSDEIDARADQLEPVTAERASGMRWGRRVARSAS
jgi:hypothetical protein